MKNKLLIHACCAPCLVAVYDDTKESLGKTNIDDFDVIWYNTNIHPRVEYEKRRDTFVSYVKSQGKEPIVLDEYNINKFIYDSMNIEKMGYSIRCEYCYTSRLEKVFEYAKDNGYTHVTTTLLISPYQKHDLIISVCNKLAKKYEVEFYYKDYRPLFRTGQNKARELGLYRQKYCGCIFSEDMRYNNHNPIQTSNTNGYEIPKEPRMQVKKIENKEDYIDLLLEADPSKDMIHKYLNDSDVYAIQKADELISIAVILHIDRKTLELKNIVTKENFRNKGYAKTLLKSLCGNYKQKYDRMLVGTTENNIPFYVKQGFDKYEKTIKNFFIDNYKGKIKDGELTCTDLIYYSKDLKKK